MKNYLLLLFLALASIAIGQLPNTDLYMLTIKNNGQKIKLVDPIYISGFNPDGYNNQPAFNNPRELYLTTDLYDKTFTDFIKLDFMQEKYYRVTDTKGISEYSPTPKAVPRYFSAVRVEADKTTQSLWLYPKDHSNGGKRVLSDYDNIGYHCWLTETEVALFVLGETMDLVVANIESGKTRNILKNVGRCFRQNRDGALIFIHKVNKDVWYLKSYSPETQKTATIMATRPGSEDFELISDGTILMGEGSKIYSVNPNGGKHWTEVVNLEQYGINTITRMATSRNRLVIVDKVGE
ncbi:MAG: hypothetical protein V3V14_10330 [Saprospiraceae bacterium]